MNIAQNFLKPELLKDLLKNISFHKKENHTSPVNIIVGSECVEYLCKLRKEVHVNVIIIIRQNCLQFYTILIILCHEEIKKRLPVNNIFLHKLKSFQPNVSLFLKNRETSFNDVSFITKTLNGFDEDNLKEVWLMLFQFH